MVLFGHTKKESGMLQKKKCLHVRFFKDLKDLKTLLIRSDLKKDCCERNFEFKKNHNSRNENVLTADLTCFKILLI